MANLVFSGPYDTPTVITVPGLVSPDTNNPVTVWWGEDVTFTFPDPGVNCTLRLVLKLDANDAPAAIAIDYVRTSTQSSIPFTITGPDARQFLIPGIYYWELIKIIQVGQSNSFLPVADGTLSIVEGTGSLEVTPSTGVLAPLTGLTLSYPSPSLALEGAAVVGSIFGFFRVPSTINGMVCTGMDIAVQSAPVGAALTIDIMAVGGSLMNKVGSVASGQTIGNTTFGTPLAMPAGSLWQLEVLQVGSTSPGESVLVSLNLQVVPAS